jgi:hypothetical protein
VIGPTELTWQYLITVAKLSLLPRHMYYIDVGRAIKRLGLDHE